MDRLEKGEKSIRQRQEDEQEEEDSDEEGEDIDQAASLKASITADQIEAASTDELLAMLTPKEKQRFLDAVKSPKTAAQLMQRMDRKADRLAEAGTSAMQQGVLIAELSPLDQTPPQPAVKRAWQSTIWFERQDACPDFSEHRQDQASAWVATLEKILQGQGAASSKAGSLNPVNLVYNLCTVLMAYAYTLRHLDVASLSGLTKAPSANKATQAASTASAPSPGSRHLASSLFKSLQSTDDDDEPPPLEPDEPIEDTDIAFPAPPDSVSTSPKATVNADPSIAAAALDKLDHLVPFLLTQPTPTKKATHHSQSSHDSSKLVLTSLQDASMWLLSRLSLESEVGESGVDAINLQLLQDLARLLAGEQLVPTFGQQEDVEPRFHMALNLTHLPPQQAFVAAQLPSLTNAIADLYFFLDDLATRAASHDSLLAWSAKSIKLAQRKLCFYFFGSILSDHAMAKGMGSNVWKEAQEHAESLRRRIEVSDQADKLAAAVSKLQ